MTFTEFKRALIEGKYLRKRKKEKIKKKKLRAKKSKRNRAERDENIGTFFRKFYTKKLPVVENRLMLTSFNGFYTCNPKYIAEYIIDNCIPIEMYWGSVKDGESAFPEEINLVRKYSFDYFRAMATSKVWIDNALNCVWKSIPKKKEQIHINTWHGSMGLKRISKENIIDENWLKRAEECGKSVDYCISDSDFETMVYRETYFENNEVLEYGHPRNDILFCNEKERAEIKKRVCDTLGVVKHDKHGKSKENISDIKMCLYAPTFRDSQSMEFYNVNYDKLIEALKKKFGGEWKVLTKLHFHDRKAKVDMPDDPNVINATDYLDIQELMVACDIGITDYSSWICDFVLTGKPGFIFATDLEEFNTGRGLYYPLEETPFPIATNNVELVYNIITFDSEKYSDECKRFLKDRGCKEDGHAAERVVKLICEKMGITQDMIDENCKKVTHERLVRKHRMEKEHIAFESALNGELLDYTEEELENQEDGIL